MMAQYTKEQIDKILQKLPDELHEAVFSMETADAIWNTCTKQNIVAKRLSKIAEYTGYVLMGLILPQEFEPILIKDIKVPKKAAQEIAREINRFVFYPVKSALEQLHSTQITATSKNSATKPIPQETKEPELPKKSSGPDVYQEPLDEE